MSRTPSRDKLALVVAELQYVRDKLDDSPKLAEIINEQITVIEQTIEMLRQSIWPLADSDHEFWMDVDNQGGWMCVLKPPFGPER